MSPDETLLSTCIPQIPKCLQLPSIIKGLVSYADSQNYTTYKKAAHVFLWAPWEGQSMFGVYMAAVMMQMRFDGAFGFPGGLIDEGEDVIEGVNRELEEEIGWDAQKSRVTWVDYYSSQVNTAKEVVHHFFIKEISMGEFKDLEKKSLTSRDQGSEVLGLVRVPLYTMSNNYGGLPAFLNNRFAGAAKQQLLLALYHTQQLNEVQIQQVTFNSQNMKLAASRF